MTEKMASIDKKEIEHLAELAKIRIGGGEPDDAKAMTGEEEKLVKNFQEILVYFDQLKEVNTDNVEPMNGGTMQTNVFREDEKNVRDQINSSADDIIDAFPEKEGRFLQTPPVFEG
jgi:aspartyl-tRNA(Asn)/glutamyl-tRNA(Gln) amidotransferase subunit C